jgi:predicted nucleotidyltransferase component of viral defense system
MTLHEQPEYFADLVTQTSNHLHIPEFFIEKDYWVCYVLQKLSFSEYRDTVVFKGGTSLSKAYDCIERFSEDIDLALIDPPLGDAKRKTLMKKIEEIITEGLTCLPDHPQTEKRSRNRRTFYAYPLTQNRSELSPVKEVIQLEINTFTHPAPNQSRPIEPFIARFLRENGFESYIAQYGLDTFSVQVLSIERTLCEKTLSLIRLSYEGGTELLPKIRHFYDIARIVRITPPAASITKVFIDALNDDTANATFRGRWQTRPLCEAPLFTDYDSLWKELERTYTRELSDLVWNREAMPSPSEVKTAIMQMKNFVAHE